MILLRAITDREKLVLKEANVEAMVAGMSQYKRANQQAVKTFCEAQVNDEVRNAQQTDLETILTIVSTETNQVVGSIWYRLHNDAVYSDLVFICWLGIYPAYRRKGYARAALDQVAADLKQQGIKRMALQAFNNHQESMSLYESYGLEAKRTVMHKYL
ncbi:hypothetical protein MNBD_GAMMA22-336 [hydrothermal vent metagenome]|uniref:N-acetyltransferase domain-containing protein n=1 Tax=hydrothermal vent metagenome TaxID=652676 RepID=A0A3B0ZG73_9ZZZZ